MCGAFSVIHPFKELGRPFNAGYNGPDLPSRFNARPGQDLPVILNEQPDAIQLALWGITPAWKKDKKMIINTRKESLDTKPTFMESFHSRRCLVPADGFYEWTLINGRKIPFMFRLKTKDIFAFAGLWQIDGKYKRPAFTIITTEPNELVGKVHDRMPAILPAHREKAWLDADTDPADLLNMLEPYPAKLMEAYPVSPLVNSAKNDSPEIIKPIKF